MKKEMAKKLLELFAETYGDTEGVRVFFAPGRINLIGEHTDYNGGHVLPCPIEMGTYCAIRPGKSKKTRMFSGNFPETGVIEWDMSELKYRKEAEWSNYPAGVVWAVSEKGLQSNQAVDLAFLGDIPNQSGLSSSASIEMVTGYAGNEVFNLNISLIDLALMGQKAENIFVGMGCGIMDQFTAALGKAGHAIFLNAADLSYEYVPVILEEHCLLIMNTCKQRHLTTSKYNERLAECRKALIWLQFELDVDYLCDISEEQFEEYKYLIEDPTEQKRAKHVIYENARTIRAKALLEEDNLEEMGKLLNESHLSLQQDYEVTGVELDTLVSAAWEQDGVLGARMTGAGFGGCAICIAERDKVDEIIRRVGETYAEKIGYNAEFYLSGIGDGPEEIDVR